jgi:hypothetical protein
MDPDRNPYAPPVTSEASDTIGDEPRSHRPARVLWPLCLLSFLRSAASALWFRQAMRPDGRLSDTSQATAHGVSTLVASVVSMPLAALLGDRRPARLLVLLSLLLQAGGTLAGLLPISGMVLTTALHTAVNLGGYLAGTVVTAYVLRAVTVRGVYIALFFLDLVRNVAWSLMGYTSGWLGPTTSIAVGAGCALLAASCLLKVRTPEQTTVLDTVEDPLIRPPVSRWGAIGLVLLMAAYFACAGTIQFNGPSLAHATGVAIPVYPIDLHRAPAVLTLVIPFLAYGWRWRPRILVGSGMLVSALGGLVTAGSGLTSGQTAYRVATGGLATVTLGHDVLADTAGLALIRQNVTVTRIALWAAVYFLAGSLLRMGLMPLSYQLLGGLGHLQMLATALLILPLAVGLLVLLRGR